MRSLLLLKIYTGVAVARAIAVIVFITIVMTISSNIAFANPCGKGALMQQFYQKENLLRFRLKSYLDNNLPIQASKFATELANLNTTFPYVWLRQEIQNFPLFGNVGCLIAAMGKASGQNLGYQPYTDGKLDLLHNGKKIRDRITKTDLLSIARSMR